MAIMQVGDIIKYRRRCINHYAIYIGTEHIDGYENNTQEEDHKIIHRTNTGDPGNSTARPNSVWSGSGATLDKAIIKAHHWEAPIDTNYGCYIDNYYDKKYKPLSPDEIVQRAKSQLGKSGYNILFRNCEHFATWCRYGEAKISREVTHKVAAVGLSAGAAASGGVAVGITAGAVATSALATATGIGATVGAVLGPIGIGIGAGIGAGVAVFATHFGLVGSKIKP